MLRFRLRTLLLLMIAAALLVYGLVAYRRYQIEHLFVSVIDRTDGTPLAQFRYRTTIRTERGETLSPWGECRSDTGRLTIKVPIHSRVWLDVESDLEDTKYALQSEELVVSPSNSHRWTRRMTRFVPLRNPNRVAGWLVDSESKLPIANARIYRFVDTIQELQISPYISDDNGRFVMEERSRFIVHHPVYEQTGTRVGESFELDRCKRVSGTVLSPNGKGIADCIVEIKKTAQDEMAKVTKTDEDGRFSILLTKAEIQANKLEISHKDWQTARIETESKWKSVLSITLNPANSAGGQPSEPIQGEGDRTIRGKVACDSSEFRNIMVQLRTENEVALRRPWGEYQSSKETSLDKSGQFVFSKLKDEHYELMVCWKNQNLCRRPIVIQGGNIDLPEVKLPERGTIRGRISIFPPGQPKAFEQMWFSDFSKTKAVPIFTDQDGEFTIHDLLPGKWLVGEGSFDSSALHTNRHHVKEVVVSPSSTATCNFLEPEPLQIEIGLNGFLYSNRRNFGSDKLKLVVGEPTSNQLVASFDRKVTPHAELFSREGNRRLIQLTVYKDSGFEIINRELTLEKGAAILQWPDGNAHVSIDVFFPNKTALTKTGAQTIVTFLQSGIEKHRFVCTPMGSTGWPNSVFSNSSLLESGNYDITVHNDGGWAKLNCTVPKDTYFSIGPIECQLGGSIAGRVHLADKQAYPTCVRVTSKDGFAIERSLVGRDGEVFQFTGLPPGKWKITLIDNTQTEAREVMKSAFVEISSVESLTIDL